MTEQLEQLIQAAEQMADDDPRLADCTTPAVQALASLRRN